MPYGNPLGYLNPSNFSRSRRVTKTPEEELEEKIKRLRNRGSTEVTPQKKSILSQLLSSLPQAIGVAISDNPGQALQLQFERQQQEQLALTEAMENRRREKERFEREIDLFDIQRSIEKMKEEREIKRKREEKLEERGFESGERKKERLFRKEEREAEIQFKDKADQRNYRQQVELLHLNTQASLDVDKARSLNKREGDALELQLVLIRNKVPPNQAKIIAQKTISGEELDKKEAVMMSKALIPVIKTGRIGGTGQVKFKDRLDYQEARLRAFQTGFNAVDRVPNMGVNAQGVTYPILDVQGQPTFKVATEQERINAGIRSMQVFDNATSDIKLILEGGQTRQAGIPQDSTTKDSVINRVFQQIDEAIQQQGIQATIQGINNSNLSQEEKQRALVYIKKRTPPQKGTGIGRLAKKAARTAGF